MTIDEAASELRKMYGSAEYADKSIAVVLFGLNHADHLARLYAFKPRKRERLQLNGTG